MQPPAQRDYNFDDFCLDVPKRQLLRAGEPIQLSPKAFDLLLVLVENAGQLLSKQTLFERVWQDQIVEESNLTVNMSAIRRALGERAARPRYITTVSGGGYCFVGDVRDFAGDEEYVVERHTVGRLVVEQVAVNNEPLALPPARSARTPIFVLVGSILIAALGLGAYLASRSLHPQRGPFSPIASSMRKLTNSGKAGQAALSPDGKLFAFSLRDAGRSSLWLGYVDGGEPIEIRQPAEMNYLNVRFSPDGSSLYYVASETFAPRGELYRLPVLGGAPERLVTNIRGAVTFASDGKRMAFVRIDPESQNQVLVVTDLRASNEKTITSPPAGSAFVANTAGWCPQSDLIAIGVSAQDPAPSGKIYMVDVSNGSMNALKTDEWSSVGGVTWLHDGSGLIVVATQKDVLAPQLWRVPYPEGESSRVVTDLSFYGSTLSLSADDQNLLAVQVQQESNIWSAPSSDLGKAQQITFGSPGQNNGWLGLQWLRDGRLIYTKQENSSISIWSTSTDGTAPRQLVPSGGINTLPSVPDSERYIVFQSNRSGTQSVWRSDLDGSNLRQLTTAGVAGEPRVSPDGKWVVYIADRDGSGDLLRIPIDGGESRKLSDKQFSWVSVSPDSRQIAGGCDDGGRQKLCIISIDGGPVQRTFDIPRLANFRLGVRWTPDGHGITYRDWGYGIWRQNVDGGEPVLLKDLPQEKFYGYGWSPDGKRFAYARGAEVDDVVWMSGLAH